MEILWFCLVAIMIAAYVILDGFDLGAGIVHLSVARSDSERRQALAAIGPVWDGNEVWLLAAGGTLYFAFPALYASSFSGFYLPLMIVLWLLILRGISIEFRNHIESPAWGSFWDAIFCGASALLAIFFGAALGNVVRGVPLDASGDFFLPLWTNFQPGADAGILDWYTVLCAVTAFAVLTLHGASWLALKTTGPVNERAGRIAAIAWWGALAAAAAITVASFAVQPRLAQSFRERPWLLIFPVFAAGSLFAIRAFAIRAARQERLRFLASACFIAGMLNSAAAGVFPYVLPSVSAAHPGLTVFNAAPARYGLALGLAWWIPAFFLAVGYVGFVYRRFAGKVAH
jgi:cytochrome d ubiquinol oxidase subunit II